MHDCNRVKLQRPLAFNATQLLSSAKGGESGSQKQKLKEVWALFQKAGGSNFPDKQIYELNNETQITGDTIRFLGFRFSVFGLPFSVFGFRFSLSTFHLDRISGPGSPEVWELGPEAWKPDKCTYAHTRSGREDLWAGRTWTVQNTRMCVRLMGSRMSQEVRSEQLLTRHVLYTEKLKQLRTPISRVLRIYVYKDWVTSDVRIILRCGHSTTETLLPKGHQPDSPLLFSQKLKKKQVGRCQFRFH